MGVQALSQRPRDKYREYEPGYVYADLKTEQAK